MELGESMPSGFSLVEERKINPERQLEAQGGAGGAGGKDLACSFGLCHGPEMSPTKGIWGWEATLGSNDSPVQPKAGVTKVGRGASKVMRDLGAQGLGRRRDPWS